MDIINQDVEQYIDDHSTPESEVLAELNRETYMKIIMPHMLSGSYQGQLLQMISHMIKPKLVLEIGTFTGYSAICLAQGLADEGKVITLDINEELEDMVHEYVAKAGLSDKIEMRIGNAHDMIEELPQEIDLVFIDADKKGYANYYETIFDKVKTGGFILADNVLWKGKVVDPTKKDKDTEAIRAFNKLVHDDERVENVLLPIRDGLLLVRKK